MKPLFALAAWLLASSVALPVSAQSTQPADAHEVIQRMLDRNPSLASFRSRVHVDIHMHNFPFLAPKLDGTSYFKRPNNYEVVFDRVPGYARGFSKLFDDVGDPASWERDQDVTFAGTQDFDGHPMLVLRLTKKIHSTILDHALAFVDPSTYELARMEWHYTSGGTIVMTQVFRNEGGFTVISSQHATIDIPHIHAVADSTYAEYQTNVAVDDAVFQKK